MKASTFTADVEFDGAQVTITRKAVSSQGRGVKVIPLSQIGSVQLRPPSRLAVVGHGSWSISVVGEVSSSSSSRGSRGGDRGDENSVEIGPGHVKAFQALTDAINAARSQPASAPVVPAASAPDLDREGVIAQLRQLGSMHHQGQIADEVFIRQMHTLLPRL